MNDDDAIEEALVAHWSNFGKAPGGSWRQEGGLVWVEAPVAQLPYNAVLRTRLDSASTGRIEEMVRHFRNRNVQFIWFVQPSDAPGDLPARLEACGLSLVETGTGMSLDLSGWQRPAIQVGTVTFSEVASAKDHEDFESLMAAYWELSGESQSFAFQMSRWVHESRSSGIRWLAHVDGKPVGKAYLSLLGHADSAAIFGVYVLPEARGMGIARALNQIAISRAADLGRKRVVLHSSSKAVNVYLRLGFIQKCSLGVYATAPLHAAQSKD